MRSLRLLLASPRIEFLRRRRFPSHGLGRDRNRGISSDAFGGPKRGQAVSKRALGWAVSIDISPPTRANIVC